jgi:NAD(P)-dependent dehydrogenase (short-subunit alcohol dehydrogenase family)
MDLQLTGRRVLVTGGTRGIGRAVVEAFLDEGRRRRLLRAGRGGDHRDRAGAGRRGGAGAGIGRRRRGRGGLAAWVSRAAEELGGIDVVVSNVSALAIPESEESWRASFEVDLMGCVRLVGRAMPHLLASDAAAVVAVSSVSGREVDFAAGPYGTMKAALVHYVQGLAHQLAGKGVRANTVSPGNTFFEGGVWDQIRTATRSCTPRALALNPTGRMGTPQEMARAVVFLASPTSSFTTAPTSSSTARSPAASSSDGAQSSCAIPTA